MIDVVKWIAGLMLFIYELKELSAWSRIISNCTVTTGHGEEIANCSRRGLTSIPQNLPENLTWLEISHNVIKILDKSALMRYPRLKHFIMKNLTVGNAFPIGFFQNNKELMELGIGMDNIGNLKQIPNTVTLLNYAGYNKSSIDLSHLYNLRTLNMRWGNLTKIPDLYVYNKDFIRVVDLRHHPLTEAKYTDIAPFCSLKFFGILSNELRNETYVDQCCGFVTWLHKTMPGVYGYKLQGCNVPPPDNNTCVCKDFVLDNNAIAEFNICKNRNRNRLIFVIIFGLFLIGLGIALTVNLVYHLHVVSTFEGILLWFAAKEVTDETPPTEMDSEIIDEF